MRHSISRLFFILLGCISFFGMDAIISKTYSNTIWVNATNGDDIDGDGSEANPYQSISFAIDNVSQGDTVTVVSDTYRENISILNKPDFILRGESALSKPLIVGTINAPTIDLDPGELTSTRKMVIENLIITHDTDIEGSGLKLFNSSLSIKNCEIIQNQNSVQGAGIWISSDRAVVSPLIENSRISQNVGGLGAGIYIENTPLELRSSELSENSTESDNGGAIALVNCFDVKIYQNSFFNNSAVNGAAVFIQSDTGLSGNSFFQDNMVYENNASFNGGGLYLNGNTVVWTFRTNSIAENVAGNNGGAAYIESSTTVFFRKNIIVKNSANNNGGAIAFVNVTSAINILSNNITGNKAFNNGGGLFLENANTVSVGGASTLSNNLFHNRDNNQLNNITSTNSITSLNLSQNYWGTSDQPAVAQQLSIPGINTSWETFRALPENVEIKLFSDQKYVWFADGKIEFNQGNLSPVGDSTLVVRTHPDTTFNVGVNPSLLPKIFLFDWTNVNMTGTDAKISFDLDASELDLLERPIPQTIQILEKLDTSWNVASTEVNDDGSIITTSLPSFNISLYTVGLDLSSLFFVDPQPNRADVNKNNPFKIIFQREMDETTLVKANIYVKGSLSGSINFNSLFNSPTNTLYITPQDMLHAGETITITMSDLISTVNTGAIENGFSWRFRTSAFRGKALFRQAGIIQTRSGTNEYLFSDFNDDQLPELIELSGSNLTIFSNINGTYTEENSINTGNGYSKIKLADLNADGVNEIVLFNDTEVFAYSYDLLNGFTIVLPQKSYESSGPLKDAVIDDFNNDLIPDMAVLLDLGDFSQIDCYYGDNSSGYNLPTFTSVILTGDADKFSSTDWNNDGMFDMISSKGADESSIGRIVNQNDSFTSFFNSITEITSQTVVTTANVWENGLFTGADEVIIAGTTDGGLNLIKLYNIDEDGALVQRERREFEDPINSVYAADFNSDGHNDLAIGHTNRITLMLSTNGILNTISTIATPIVPENILSIDFDSDGDLDLLVSQHIDASTSWIILENESRQPRTWWVDNNSEDGDGSLLNPFKFINKAIEKSFSGDSILIHPGNYEENLNITHDLFVASQDTSQVVLKFDQQDVFSTAVLSIVGTQFFEAHNLAFEDDILQAGTLALFADNNDSLVLGNIHIEQFEKAAQFNNSKGQLNAFLIEDNNRGLQFNGSDMSLFYLDAQRNNEFGLASINSVLSVSNAEIHENGSNSSANSSGINIINGSDLTLYEVSLSENNNANILLNNSTLRMQFGFVGEALSNGISTDGNGIYAQNNANLFIENSVVVDNHKIGLAIENSQATIINSIIANNDSLFTENGGGLFARNSSTVDLRNSILLGNNTAVSSENSTVNINYNDFYANNSALSGASLAAGNISENPLLVFMFNPFGADGQVDGFYDLKLSAGSGLIDKGDPALTNGQTQSRSDIGLFGNLALPAALSSIPEATVSIQDSAVTLSWQQALVEEQGLFRGTMIFKDSVDNFQPDTLNMLGFVQAGITDFRDNNLNFGKDAFYRFAFVDSNGASNAYSPVLQGRIDFKEIRASLSNLNVQLGQGDTLIRPIVVTNTGTVPITINLAGTLPNWLKVAPKQHFLQRNENSVFLFRFDGTNLQKDSLYTSKLEFVVQEDTTIRSTLDLQMLVSYRDLAAPNTSLFRLYPDTIRQANLSFSFSANDTSFSTIGTPLDLMRFVYRFVKIDDILPTIIDADTTTEQRLDFFPLNNGSYLFQVAALDTAGNGALEENSASVTVNVKSGELDIVDGYWQMVSMPRQILGTDASIQSDNLKALRHWQDDHYEHVSPDSVIPGKGYWVFSTSKIRVDLLKYPAIESDKDFNVDLQEGWNMIGNPWSWNIGFENITITNKAGTTYNFDEAVTDGLINPGIYYWQASRLNREYKHEMSGQMQMNTGYWLQSNQAVTLNYNPQPFVAFEQSLPKRSASISSNEQDALVRLKVKHKYSADNDNYFGLCLDKSDYPHFYQSALEPPAIYDNIRLYSKIDGRKLTTNLVSFSSVDSSQSWDLIIEGVDDEEETILSWENINSVSQMYFYLYHLESGEWFNINDRDSFVIENKKSQNHFKLIASEDENFEPDILPTKFALSQNYPNPFNPTTTIKMSVPFFANGENVKLDVFDVLGRKVKNLLNKAVKSGELEVTWRGKNSLGKQVASGIYFYRVSAGDFIASKKMILIR